EDGAVLQRFEETVDPQAATGGLQEGDDREHETEHGDEATEADPRAVLLERGRRRQVQRPERSDEGEPPPRVGRRQRLRQSELRPDPSEERQARQEERRGRERQPPQIEAPALVLVPRERIENEPTP